MPLTTAWSKISYRFQFYIFGFDIYNRYTEKKKRINTQDLKKKNQNFKSNFYQYCLSSDNLSNKIEIL